MMMMCAFRRPASVRREAEEREEKENDCSDESRACERSKEEKKTNL
jgi:hypothetical protein